MSATRIRVDFNSRAGGGLVRSSLRRADSPVSEGDRVIAYQPGENMERFGRVVEVDESSGRLTIDVDWDSQPAVATVEIQEGSAIRFVMSRPLPYRLTKSSRNVAQSSRPATASRLAGVR